ncbi:uncharacterized protein N7506_001907 [Penicillium brevicompactum]|uniref:uncharacterized protein n=1 Tax=Penicillium brevicompactum TaxID=5074 RepID=UPI002540935A|nr:uncharacterized protein N7506_003208 [Penicillium brevicompactum]XP_056817118.1 uncharacterized protein N7506_001907 [Penicillium brevicompactum]KAJ5343384.1 hypothetical protein N7506_003208 [Penicillium brevicompactum]KAJ5348654.1 hypothetical protein N7506_001907 [Penicillium brevicompactum]
MDMNDRTKKREFDVYLDAGASFGAQGLLNVGRKVYHDKEVSWAKEYAISSDFVYAYRVAKVYFSVRQNALKTRGIKGELFGLNEDFAQDRFDRDGAYTCEAKMQEDDEWFLAEGSFSEIDDEDGDNRLLIPL